MVKNARKNSFKIQIRHGTIVNVRRKFQTQLPLTMCWAIIIHKSQVLTLQMATIDIGTRERYGLTFTTISRVKSIDDL